MALVMMHQMLPTQADMCIFMVMISYYRVYHHGKKSQMETQSVEYIPMHVDYLFFAKIVYFLVAGNISCKFAIELHVIGHSKSDMAGDTFSYDCI